MKKPNITKDTIDFYYDQGFILIPIDMRHGKKPLHNNWTKREYSKEVITGFAKRGFNLGFQIPKDYCVIDVDPKNGGVDSFKRLCDFLGDDKKVFLTCPEVYTGGHKDGRHYYLKMSTTEKIKETIKDFPGVEFKKKGKQVLIPGCVHPDTGKYYIFGNDEKPKSTQLPNKLVDFLAYKVSKNTQSQQISNEELRYLLQQLPVGEYSSNDDWFLIMAASFSATNGLGIDEFIEWSISDPNYSDQGDIIRLRWTSLEGDIEGGRTLGTLLQEVTKHGGQFPLSITMQGDFEDSCDDVVTDYGVEMLLEEISCISKDITEKELEKYFNVLMNLNDTIVSERVFKALRNVLNVPVQNFRSAYKKYIKKQEESIFTQSESIDYADLVAGKILKTKFNDGKHLIHAKNQQFYGFNGKFWETIEQNIIEQIIYNTSKEVLKESSYDFKVSQIMSNTEKLLRAKTATKEDLLRFKEIPPSVVNTQNYELWIDDKTGKITVKEHEYKSYLNYCVDIEFNKEAKCPIFDQALEKMFCAAKEPSKLIDYLWEIFGYIIQSKKNLACWFLFHGHGDNGKSFVIDVLCKLLGSEMILPRNIADFSNSNNAHAMASLPGKLLILDDDLKKNISLPDGVLKKLSEAKFLESNPKGKKTFNFVSVATPVLLSNHWPAINDVSKGFLRRINVVPFCYELKREEIILDLIDKIKGTELQGILNRALIGLQRLRKRERFNPPNECKEKINYWLGLTNPVIRFITTCCTRDDNSIINISDLYDEFLCWATSDRGIARSVPIGQFEELLSQRGYRVKGSKVSGLILKPGVNQ